MIFVLLFLTAVLGAKESILVVDENTARYDVIFEHVREALAKDQSELLKGTLRDDHSACKYVVVLDKPGFIKKKHLLNLPKKKGVLFTWSSPVASKKLFDRKYLRHFKRIYTWDESLVDNKRFFKLYPPALKPMQRSVIPFSKKKLLTAHFDHKSSKHPQELYSEWRRAIFFFEEHAFSDFEFFGLGWSDSHPCLKESAQNLSNFRFTLCYEDMKEAPGYITEKIFDAFAAGTVPIYLGASNIESYIPKACFIDRRDFSDDAALYEFIKNISADEHEAYITKIQEFLASPAAKKFSKEYFEVVFLESIRFP
jgi:hypothetical protein